MLINHFVNETVMNAKTKNLQVQEINGKDQEDEIINLKAWGNAFSLILQGKKLSGWFLDNKVFFETKDSSLLRFKNELFGILQQYRFYGGVYSASVMRYGRWKMVVTGWIGMLSDYSKDVIMRKLIEIEDLKVLTSIPVLFVFPRSSNVALIFDVWTTDVSAFKKVLGVKYDNVVTYGNGYRLKVL